MTTQSFIARALTAMCSNPGEALKDIRATSAFLNRMLDILRDINVNNQYVGAPAIIYPGTELGQIARNNGNIFEEGFSWNTYHETDKARDFGPSRHVVYFENPDLSLQEILDGMSNQIFKEKSGDRLMQISRALIPEAASIRSPAGARQLLEKCRRYIRRNIL